APEKALGTKYPIQVIQAGPMLTRPNGYPLDAWGSDGYGVGCDSWMSVSKTIKRLKREGAGVIKIALDDDGLDPGLLEGAVLTAHGLGMKVVVHAVSDESAFQAGKAGADVLAHTPLEPLTARTIQVWMGRAVISTLAAFGGSPVAIENLRKLRASGVTVLYGTDLGNLRVDGPSGEEMELMKSAGMTDDDVQNAMTTVPWHFWGFDTR
ncbi:MAG TPA: hypothetical protein VL326_14155, partial [Kofleriaceae bacterium]|nr:hypothetical protein [Kofleriaceae bacterium]